MYVVNLHAAQRNASSHSKNLRASLGGPSRYDDIVKLIQRIRDEAHRFAVSYHTVLTRKQQTKTILEDVPGIGPATRKKLLKEFGSMRGVKEADQPALARVVGEAKAALIKKSL